MPVRYSTLASLRSSSAAPTKGSVVVVQSLMFAVLIQGSHLLSLSLASVLVRLSNCSKSFTSVRIRMPPFLNVKPVGSRSYRLSCVPDFVIFYSQSVGN